MAFFRYRLRNGLLGDYVVPQFDKHRLWTGTPHIGSLSILVILKVMFRSANLLFCISVLILIDCRFSNEYTLNGDSSVRVRVLPDSTDVRSLAEQAAQVERDLREHGQSMDDFLHSRPGKAFRSINEEMDKKPGYEVPGGTSFEILLEVGNLFYSKVRFTDGPFRGQVGWVRKGSFDDPRTRIDRKSVV